MGQWKIAKYLRLSSEDRDARGNLKNESESIGGQRKLIEDYIGKTSAFADAEVFEYRDDGYSGTNFDRPGMQRLLTAARQGVVNCIIVKDLSRFGRNYIEVGNFLEKVMPFLKVRFISVNDGYDSQDPRCLGSLDTAFKNLLNDLYSRDCSVKIKNGKRIAALQGKYQNPWAPFGYVKSKQERGKLEVDFEAAEIVRRIFVLFLQGQGTVEVARILNRDGVPTKSEYRAAKGDKMRWQYAGERNFWNAAAVRDILTDRRYIGSVVFGKRMAKEVAAHRDVKAPEEQVVEVEDCHEPLVSRDDFAQAQAMLRQGKNYGKSERPLAGKIKCGICGHAMSLRKAKEPYFTCGSKWYHEDCVCGDFRVAQRELYEVLETALRKQIELRVESERLQQVEQEKTRLRQKELEEKLARIERELEQNKEQKRMLFERFAAGEIKAEEYATLMLRNKVQAKQHTMMAVTFQAQITNLRDNKHFNTYIALTEGVCNDIINDIGMEISAGVLDDFIQELQLYPNRMVDVLWIFENN